MIQSIGYYLPLCRSLCGLSRCPLLRRLSPPMAALFIGSLSEVMDLHTKRLDWALRHRIPTVVWVAFCLLTVFSMTIMGYQAGLSGRRTQLPALLIGLAFSVVIVLRAILNSPSGVYSEVSQQAMVDLQNKISAK